MPARAREERSRLILFYARAPRLRTPPNPPCLANSGGGRAVTHLEERLWRNDTKDSLYSCFLLSKQE